MKHCRTILLLLPIALAACTQGCASAAKPERMVPASFETARKHAGSVCISVRGGKETNPMWTSQVANSDFAQALSTAIEQARLFASVADSGAAQHRLDVELQDLDQPIMGFSMTVTMKARWVLTNALENRVVFDQVVAKSFTATVGDAFAGIKRLRLANEGAARENIKEGIRRLSQLQLDTQTTSR